MTRCRDIERWVTSYVDGDLDEHRASAVRGHLRTCGPCLARVDDEVAVREAAEALEPAVEPPASLWSGIEARLADAELADSQRSRAWWWWQGARGHAFAGAAALAVVVLAVVWTARQRESATETTDPTASAATLAPAPTVTFAEQRTDEVSRADARYQQTIAELRAIAAEERAAWSAAYTRSFDERFAELDAELAKARAAAAGDVSPGSRDGLVSAYREQIAFLSEAAIEGESW